VQDDKIVLGCGWLFDTQMVEESPAELKVTDAESMLTAMATVV